MNPALILLLLRILSAILLLGFLMAITWLIYQDMRTTAAEFAARQRQHGVLRVVASKAENLPLDTGYPLLPVTTIGRSPGNTIVLEDSYTSNEHVLISLRGRQWWLEDLSSRNGTMLNGLLLKEPAVVSAGDVLTIGDTQLKVEF